MNKIYTHEHDPFYLEIPNFYSNAECDILHYQYMALEPKVIFNATRQCFCREKLDWELAKLIYNEIEHKIPVYLTYGNWYQYRSGMNGLFRHCITSTNQQFHPHMDASYTTPDGVRETRLTWLLYLSTPEAGDTNFHDYEGNVVKTCKAEKGKVVIFSHEMQHSGAPVKGCKVTLRNDIFYAS